MHPAHLVLLALSCLALLCAHVALEQRALRRSGPRAAECGSLKILGRATADRVYAADTDFKVEVPLKRGIAKRIVFDWRGTTTGPPTSVQDDAPGRLISMISAEFPKKEGGSYKIPPIAFRDLRHVADWLNGRAPRRNATAAAAAQYETVDLPLYASLPGKQTGWDGGIDVDEIGGESGTKLFIDGRYDAATAFGAATTGFTNGTLRVTVLGDVDEPHGVPRWAMLPVPKRVVTANGDTKYEDVLNKGDLHLLWALLLRMHDDSAALGVDRVNGLFSKVKVTHPDVENLWDDYLMIAQERALALVRMANGDAFAAKPHGLDGTFMLFFNEDMFLGQCPRLPGADVGLELDSETADLTGVTGVTPAANDYVMATLLGLQGNRKALEALLAA